MNSLGLVRSQNQFSYWAFAYSTRESNTILFSTILWALIDCAISDDAIAISDEVVAISNRGWHFGVNPFIHRK